MKYQVLARQYRPKTFSAMVGQEHVLKALANSLDSERLHHAYLFTGTRGVGKTTVARLLAKALNCEQGISAEPCGKCAACVEIDEGRFIDLIEVDAASRTKVEDTRDLLDNVQYAPSRGRFKIYLIDEVHMLSGHSFNALLKTLEEPPPHVKFLLATTDPQKLPVTILSRCLQFNLKSLTIEQIEQQLSMILNAENIPFANNILKPLAIAADGSMRDALSLMDQAIAYCDAKPNLTDIEVMLGSVQKERIFELLTALANDDGQALIAQSRILIEQGIDVKTVLAELITTLQRIALCQHVPDAIDDSQGDKNALVSIAAAISAEDIQLYYQIALNGRKDLPYSPQPQGGFEMILLRMLAFKPVVSHQQKKIEVPKIHKDEAPIKKPAITPVTSSASQQTSASHHEHKDIPTDHSMPNDFDLPPVEAYSQESHYEPSQILAEEHSAQDHFYYEHDDAITPGLKKKPSIKESQDNIYHPPQTEIISKEVKIPELAPESAIATKVKAKLKSKQGQAVQPSISAQKVPCVDEKTNEFVAYWYDLIERSQVKGLVQQLAKHCALVSQAEQENKLVLQLLLESVHKHLLNDKIKKRLQEALNDTLGRDVRLEIKECQLKKSEKLQTPRLREIQEAEILQQEAVKSIQTDPAVSLILNSFSAKLQEETIKPLDRQHSIH